MFTGIVEGVGHVREKRGSDKGISLKISGPEIFDDIKIGDSIAVNGVCLTATRIDGTTFTANVSAETLKNTTAGGLMTGDKVNIERALRASDRFGGHIVTGHIDGIARLSDMRNEGESVKLSFSLGKELLRYVIKKGSIAVDGVSLTVNELDEQGFSVNIIPHTAASTIILDKKPGSEANIEVDIIGKYVERLLGKGPGNRIDKTFLSEHGFKV